MRVQDQILLGQTSLAQGAVRMLQDFELSFIHAFENILINEVKTSAQRALVHKTTNIEIVASDTTSAAAGDAIHKQSAIEGHLHGREVGRCRCVQRCNDTHSAAGELHPRPGGCCWCLRGSDGSGCI
jgi:hypothetical protein